MSGADAWVLVLLAAAGLLAPRAGRAALALAGAAALLVAVPPLRHALESLLHLLGQVHVTVGAPR